MGQEQAMVAFVAVIADDLTGVCDTGAQFASAGLRTVGSVDQEFNSEDIPQVLIVNTQSRSMGGIDASRTVHQAVCGLKRFKPKWFFKKIDTALRGNIAVEISSMMGALGVDSALYIASIPGAGRTTVGGCQFYHGKPIKESIHGEDRFNPNPVWTSNNVELLSDIPGLETEVVLVGEVRSGHLKIVDRMKAGSKKVILFDSETDEDIDLIVRASMELAPSSFFYVGSFGLSKALGRFLGEPLRITKDQNKTVNAQRVSFRSKRILVVSGSSHPMARSQISFLNRKGAAEIVQIEPEDLMERLDGSILEAVRVSRVIWGRQKEVVLTIGEGQSGQRRQSRELVLNLAEIVRHLLVSNEIDGLVLIGGDTGYAVSRAVGIERVEILGNISFVAAYGRPEGMLKPLPVLVTKGGSLGEEDTLEKILKFIDLRI
jgi:uncharacterized protein YgbK (DUF1537 family)